MFTTTNHIQNRPWSVYQKPGGSWYVLSETGLFLATMATGIDRLDGEHARLFASAPSLLTALQELLLSAELNLDELEPHTVEAIERARDAVTCAIGGPAAA
ncbi:MAG: hypothetical protein GXY83_44020 [Rhodopirellula sp.]|nr:hypothetical protein [Rhodopirellula sp.]